MAKAISDLQVFGALLGGGYICEKCDGWTDARTYTVFVKDEAAQTGNREVGCITMRQFHGFVGEGIVECVAEHNKDKYGNIFRFYELAHPEKGAVV